MTTCPSRLPFAASADSRRVLQLVSASGSQRPALGLCNSDTNRLALVVTLCQQSVGDLDSFVAAGRREIQHRTRKITLVPRHCLLRSEWSRPALSAVYFALQ